MYQSGLRRFKMIQNDQYNIFLIIWGHFGPIWTLLDQFRQNLIFCLKTEKCFLSKVIQLSITSNLFLNTDIKPKFRSLNILIAWRLQAMRGQEPREPICCSQPTIPGRWINLLLPGHLQILPLLTILYWQSETILLVGILLSKRAPPSCEGDKCPLHRYNATWRTLPEIS